MLSTIKTVNVPASDSTSTLQDHMVYKTVQEAYEQNVPFIHFNTPSGRASMVSNSAAGKALDDLHVPTEAFSADTVTYRTGSLTGIMFERMLTRDLSETAVIIFGVDDLASDKKEAFLGKLHASNARIIVSLSEIR